MGTGLSHKVCGRRSHEAPQGIAHPSLLPSSLKPAKGLVWGQAPTSREPCLGRQAGSWNSRAGRGHGSPRTKGPGGRGGGGAVVWLLASLHPPPALS